MQLQPADEKYTIGYKVVNDGPSGKTKTEDADNLITKVTFDTVLCNM